VVVHCGRRDVLGDALVERRDVRALVVQARDAPPCNDTPRHGTSATHPSPMCGMNAIRTGLCGREENGEIHLGVVGVQLQEQLKQLVLDLPAQPRTPRFTVLVLPGGGGGGGASAA
jgi:hypothetical protein